MTNPVPSPGHPRVSFVLLAYKQEPFILDAVNGALAQTYGPLEIILSDDKSPDGTFELMRQAVAAYDGPHRVVVRQNERNLGLAGHINALLAAAEGDIIVLAAGDDISRPDRTERIVAAFRDRDVSLVHSAVDFMDVAGHDLPEHRRARAPSLWGEPDLAELATSMSLYIGATGAISRDLVTRFGPLRFERAYEDLVFGYRAALTKGSAFIDDRLVRYRIGNGISHQVPDGEGAAARRAMEVRMLSAWHDVLRQRLADTMTAAPGRRDLQRKLKIAIQHLRLALGRRHGVTHLGRAFAAAPLLSLLALARRSGRAR